MQTRGHIAGQTNVAALTNQLLKTECARARQVKKISVTRNLAYTQSCQYGESSILGPILYVRYMLAYI